MSKGAVAQVGFKPFVAARQGANAIQAFVSLLDQGLAPDTIERVEVSLPSEATGIVKRPLDPANRLSTIANLGLQLGIAAYERDRLLDIERTRSVQAGQPCFGSTRSPLPPTTRFSAAAARPGRRG